MSIHDEYLKWQIDLEQKYGPKSIALVRIGDFYECYQYENTGKSFELSKLLNMVLTLRDKKKPHSKKNLYMVGFPKYMLSKHLSTILKNRYTVAVYEQEVGNPKNRFLDGIYSPSTFINQDIYSNNELMVIYIDEYFCPIKKESCKAGYVSHIDLSTGKNYIYEFYNYIYNEINYLLHSINPCEIILCQEKDSNLEIKEDILIHYKIKDKDNKIFGNIEYQKSFLEKAFNNDNPIEHIGLQNNGDLLYTYVTLIQFAYEHDNSLINRLYKPQYNIKSNNLIMNNDAIFQLNLIDNNNLTTKYSSLLKVIDKTKTNMGKRLIRTRLLNPITDISIIEERYNKIEKMIPIYEKYNNLENLCDIEKKWRKINLFKLEPNELYQLYDSFKIIIELLQISNDFTLENDIINNFIKYIDNNFDINTLQIKSNEVNNIYKKDIHKDIDKTLEDIKERKDFIHNIANRIAEYVDPKKKDVVKVINDKGVFCLSISSSKYRIYDNIKDTIEIKDFDCSKFDIRKNKTNVKLYHQDFEKKSSSVEYYTKKLNELIEKQYQLDLTYLIDSFTDMFHTVIDFISDLDVVFSSAKSSVLYKYCKPLINVEISNIKCKKIRHPIIERIIDEEYIVNDVLLDDNNSLLLYGVNSCGKSSYLRSIGTNIILAQAGFYTAATEFNYNPFKKLMTKISINDNLFKNQSTFVLEMNELKYIQNNSDENSLILVDELTAGTEIDSALAIVVESIRYLLNKKSKFVFTTHIYGVADYFNDEINIKHFDIDIENQNVIFNRQLQEGRGKKLYGIEIAASLGLNKEFIRNSFNLRNENIKGTKQFLNTKQSKYNKKKFVDKCEKCGVFENLHTHHIQEQHLADKNGFIGSMHKNIKGNLMILCQKCHMLIHEKDSKK